MKLGLAACKPSSFLAGTTSHLSVGSVAANKLNISDMTALAVLTNEYNLVKLTKVALDCRTSCLKNPRWTT
jgi:hypothetical protein